MRARVSQLNKTEAEWKKLNTWIPEAGELVVYTPDENYTYARLKVGDGIRPLRDIEFLIDSAALAVLKASNFKEVIDGGRISG